MAGYVIAILVIIAVAALVVLRFVPSAFKKKTVTGCGSCNSCSSCDSDERNRELSDKMTNN
ncbi:MAG TPA: hypothetical protein DEB24_01185 [Coriobacteriia bacterium]|nr:hypothetical protein [Coriobacteriia bacterium]